MSALMEVGVFYMKEIYLLLTVKSLYSGVLQGNQFVF